MTLFEACQKGDLDQMKFFIAQKWNMGQIDEQGRTALHHCAEHGSSACVRVLLEDDVLKKSILNLQDNEGCSALQLACLNGNKLLVEYLCEQGADVNLVDNECHSLIHWITVCGHVHLLEIVRKYHTPIHTSDIYGAYPIHYASQLCGEEDRASQGLEILKKLIEYNADVNCLDGQKRTPFIWAANAGAIDALRILYKAGADSLHVDKDSLSALHCTATCGHASCIRMLVQLYGCSLEGEDMNGCTALFYAITLDHTNACQMLLDLKANPNHQDNRGRTPSHCAAAKGNIDCLKCLVKSHADIWIRNKRGDYPVHEAVNAISSSKVPRQLNESSQTERFAEVVRYIFQLFPIKVNIRNSQQRTPLHLAASLGNIEMCEVLIQCGARVNSLIQTSAGNYLTPYDLARIRREDSCADYLAFHHGGQRGNLLAGILARRIQKFFRRLKLRPALVTMNTTHKSLPVRTSTDQLLTQAKLCLENKIFEDRLKSNPAKQSMYLVDDARGEMTAEERRRQTFVRSKSIMTSMNRREDDEAEKIIIHTANSIGTSVKLYERHKLIAEELFKLKQARVHNHFIVINRPLYKILIENAFNPQSRSADEIEKYLERLLKAYEAELEAIRKRTKSVSPRRMYTGSQRKTKNKNHTDGKDS